MSRPTNYPGNLFSRILADSPVAMFITSLESGLCIDANEAFAQLVGRDREELIGLPSAEILSDSRVGMAPAAQSATVKPSHSRRILKLRHADGGFRQVIITTQIETWQEDSYQISLVQDLSNFLRTQDALRYSEARRRIFFESMPLPIFVFDTETLQIRDANQRASDHYGFSHEELLSMTMLDIRPEDAIIDFFNALTQLTDETQHVGILKHRKKDGTIIYVDVTSYALELDGRHTRLGVIQDVTEKLALEKSLRESEEQLKVITEMMTDVIWEYDIHARMVRYTDGLRVKYGYWDSEYTAIDWWIRHIHPDDREATLNSFNETLEGEETVWEAQYRFRRIDGQYAYVLDRGYILRDADGGATRMIGAMVDITRQVELQEAATNATLLERQRLARDLHDAVTQSLYSLSLMAEAARRRAIVGDQKAAADYIVRLGELAQQSLKEMRLLIYESRPAALEKDGLTGALEARLDAVERRAGIQARLSVGLEDELSPEVQVQFFRIAEEALNNALKHAAASEVQVKIEAANGSALLEISDTGKGFDPIDAHSSAGLGLVSMRERLEKLGGKFELETEPGKGTTVRVKLDQMDGNHGKHDSDIDL